MSHTKPAVQKLRRMVVAGHREAPIDTQGRILIPTHLREFAGLDKEVSILDTGARVEIWDWSRYQQELQSIQLQGQDLADEVGDLGL
jgi:MraZ protein